jgi:hypothetical protein
MLISRTWFKAHSVTHLAGATRCPPAIAAAAADSGDGDTPLPALCVVGRPPLLALLMLFIRLVPKLLIAVMGLAPPDLSVALKPAFCFTPTMDLQTAKVFTCIELKQVTELNGHTT